MRDHLLATPGCIGNIVTKLRIFVGLAFRKRIARAIRLAATFDESVFDEEHGCVSDEVETLVGGIQLLGLIAIVATSVATAVATAVATPVATAVATPVATAGTLE